ncbi:MAG: hypothetical protein RBU37_26230 [Myxococcota bacterium]|jgi:hypothetical protein|nr:hypothetical protein [Myxococcota bacterium]
MSAIARLAALALFAPLLIAATPYAVNPTLGAAGSITVDGSNSGEWGEHNVIALDLANDDPRSLGENWCMHETPWDLTHLWAAWDEQKLYLAWQYVDVTDIIDPNNAGSAGGTKPNQMNLIQWIALDTIEGAGASLDMWNKNGEQPYWNGSDLPDVQIYTASNLWQGFVSRAKDGVFPVDDGGVDYFSVEDANITIAVSNTFAVTELWGVLDADDAATPASYVDFLTRGHSTTRDTFYEMSIPLSFLGLTRAQLESGGLGVMLGQGEFSCMDTIPNDPATSDTQGITSSNSPKEWEDIDLLSVDFARVGHLKSGAPDPCAGKVCETGSHCVNGFCVPDEDLQPDPDTTDVADITEDTDSSELIDVVEDSDTLEHDMTEPPVDQDPDVTPDESNPDPNEPDQGTEPGLEWEDDGLTYRDTKDEGCACTLGMASRWNASLPFLLVLGLLVGLWRRQR